jgi:hypothetical protein
MVVQLYGMTGCPDHDNNILRIAPTRMPMARVYAEITIAIFVPISFLRTAMVAMQGINSTLTTANI